MYGCNPFTQGGWSNNGRSSNSPQSPPSVFGALPYTSSSSTTSHRHSARATPRPAGIVIYHFASFNPSLLSCTVFAVDGTPCFGIVTDQTMPGYTVVKTALGRNIGLIEWAKHPAVEIRDVLSKRSAAQWLALSHNRMHDHVLSSRTVYADVRISRHRSMEVRGVRYSWVPQDDYMCLYSTESSEILARVCRGPGAVALEMTAQAEHQGLTEACIVATILLQSGRNID